MVLFIVSTVLEWWEMRGKREEKTKTAKNEIKLWEQANVENICHAEDKENEKRRVCIKRSIQ